MTSQEIAYAHGYAIGLDGDSLMRMYEVEHHLQEHWLRGYKIGKMKRREKL